MGQSGDVDQLRDVLALLQAQGLSARRVRVGGIEVELASSPPQRELSPEPETAHLSAEEQEKQARELYESLQYGASEGVDFS